MNIRLSAVGVFCLTAALAACTPMAGQVAEAGYNVAKTSLGGAFTTPEAKATAAGQDPRQVKIQAVLNDADIGQDVGEILSRIGEAPKLKSGNMHGFTCYEFPAVYSAEDAAVILSKENKVVFYGNSQCTVEMQDANFRGDGKFAD